MNTMQNELKPFCCSGKWKEGAEMTKEYIEREAAIEELKRRDFLPVIVKHAIEAVPAADVAPVVHGRWEKHGSKWQCTGCKVLMSIDGTPQENLLYHCPNCGAKMDKEEE